MKIVTWNKLWSLPPKEQELSLAMARSIHPSGQRNARHKEKNRVAKAKQR